MADLIQYADGVHVEVSQPDRTKPVSGAQASWLQLKYGQAVQAIQSHARPLVDALQATLIGVAVKEAEITLGFAFTAEGNLFLTKATGEANLEVKIVIGMRGTDGK